MSQLREIVAELLENEGAAVDPIEPDGLDVLAPESLRQAYGWPDLVRLGFGPAAPAGSIPIGLEDDWLDRLGALLGERGRLTVCQLTRPDNAPAPNDSERLIERTLVLPNAVWRLKGVEVAWARCVLMSFRYTAVSDEKRDGLVWVGFNCTTGATLDPHLIEALRDALKRDGAWHQPDTEALQSAGPGWDTGRIIARAHPVLDGLVRDELEPFVAAMRRRLDRDRARVHAYHDDLRRAAHLKLATIERSAETHKPKGRVRRPDKPGTAAEGAKADGAITRERLRIASIEREYTAKLNDLRHNYALGVKLEWVQALVVIAPVQRHTVLVRRRKGERNIALDWHMPVRQMELAASDWGTGLSHERLACDEHLHLTDIAGQAPCSSCGKPYCRACHPSACPRCRKPVSHVPLRRH